MIHDTNRVQRILDAALASCKCDRARRQIEYSEPTVYLLFTDGTWASIVMPVDSWACEVKTTAKVRKKGR